MILKTVSPEKKSDADGMGFAGALNTQGGQKWSRQARKKSNSRNNMSGM